MILENLFETVLNLYFKIEFLSIHVVKQNPISCIFQLRLINLYFSLFGRTDSFSYFNQIGPDFWINSIPQIYSTYTGEDEWAL